MYQQNLFNTITTGMGYPTRFRMLPVLLLSDPIPSLSFLKWKLLKNVVFPSRKPQVLTITITKIKKYERTYRFLISALGSSSGLCPYVWSTELGVLTSKSWPLIPENKEEKFLWHWMKRHWTKQQSLHSTNTYSSYTDAIKSIFTSNSHGCCKTWTMGDTAQTIHPLKTCLECFSEKILLQNLLERTEMVSSKKNNIIIIEQEHGLVITFSLIALSLRNRVCLHPDQQLQEHA